MGRFAVQTLTLALVAGIGACSGGGASAPLATTRHPGSTTTEVRDAPGVQRFYNWVVVVAAAEDPDVLEATAQKVLRKLDAAEAAGTEIGDALRMANQPGHCWVGIEERYVGKYVLALYTENDDPEPVRRAARVLGIAAAPKRYETMCYD
jgi:hypothetical protein